jgi:hypothetical protein
MAMWNMFESRPLGTAVKTATALIMGQGTVCMEGLESIFFWLKDVQYAPGLTQNLYSMNAGRAKRLALTVNRLGEFVSLTRALGHILCCVVKTNSQYLLDAKALDGDDRKTYLAMLAREGRTLDVHATLTSFEVTDLCELCTDAWDIQVPRHSAGW